MRSTRNLVAACACLAVSAGAWAQSERVDVSRQVRAGFEQLRQERPLTPIPDSVLTDQPLAVLDVIRAYEHDDRGRLREYATALAWRVGLLSEDRKVRQTVVEHLVAASGDPDPLVWQHAAKRLLSFERVDFSAAARGGIHALLAVDSPNARIVRLPGVAGMREELPRLQTLLIDESLYESRPHSGRWYGTASWAARLVRARLGVSEDLDRVIELVAAEPDDIVRVTILLRDLAFTRQPAALGAIGEYLNSDERLPPVKVGVPGTRFTQYALDALAEGFPSCPVPRKGIGVYTPEDLDIARQWVSAGRGSGVRPSRAKAGGRVR